MPRRPRAPETFRIGAIAVEDEDVLSTYVTGIAVPGRGGAPGTFEYGDMGVTTRTSRQDRAFERPADDEDFISMHLLPAASECLGEHFETPLNAFGISAPGRIIPDRAVVMHDATRGLNIGGETVTLDLANSLRSVAGGAAIVAQNDVTAAAFGEYLWGSFAGYRLGNHHAFAYVWVGRGIGAGFVIGGEPWRGGLHPDMGHIRPRRYTDLHGYVTDPYPGYCPQHQDCINGLAGYRTFIERVDLHKRPEEEALEMIAHYVAQLCAIVTLTVVPVRIAVGGLTLRRHKTFLNRVHAHYPALVRGVPGYDDAEFARQVIIPAKLGDSAALFGMLEIARRSVAPNYVLQRRVGGR